MITLTRRCLLIVLTLILVSAVQGIASAPLPNPILNFLGQEQVTISGKQMIRYHYDVANKSAYPDDMFAPAPDLPPCGTNTKAARTWVDIYEQGGKRLFGFCSLGKSSDLGKIYFTLDENVLPPSYVYIEMVDRKTNTKYKSNLADTTL